MPSSVQCGLHVEEKGVCLAKMFRIGNDVAVVMSKQDDDAICISNASSLASVHV